MTVDHELLSFLHAYLSYNQILMYQLEAAKTTFITLYDMYCYNMILFGLKNVGATYKHMMSRVFEPPLGRTMEAYVNDILVKSQSPRDHLTYLREAFCLLRQHRLWLNHAKCAFGVSLGNFLGFLVS